MHVSRRQFVRQAACASVAAVTWRCPAWAADDGPALPIVDTHQHLWDLSMFKLPWLESAAELRRSYVSKDYVEASRGLNVRAVYMEVDVDPAQQVVEAEHVIALCHSGEHPTVAAVISGRPGSDEFPAYIRRFKDSPYIKGVRRILHDSAVQRGHCLGEEFVNHMRLLGELGLSFDLCMRPTELLDGVKLADLCPDTRFIVDHCGNADPKAFGAAGERGIEEAWHQAEPWRNALTELAQRKNVVCKISGIVARAPKDGWKADHLAPIVNHCLDQFGPDRVMFGSDWPVCTLVAPLRDWVAALREITNNRGAEQQLKLFHDNAVKFYGI